MSNKITFQQLIDRIAEESGQSKQFTHDFLKDLVSVINKNLGEGESVKLAGFGEFQLRKVNEQIGIDPNTGEPKTIPEHQKVVFNPSNELSEKVNTPFAHLEPKSSPDDNFDDTATDSNSEDEGKPLDENSEQQFIPTGPPPEVESEINLPNDLDQIDKDSVSEDDPFGFGAGSQSIGTFSLDNERSDEENGDEYDVVEYEPGMDEEDDGFNDIFFQEEDKEKNTLNTGSEDTEEKRETDKPPSDEEKQPSKPVEKDEYPPQEQQKREGINFNDRRSRKKRKAGAGLLVIMAAIFLVFILAGSWYFMSWMEDQSAPPTGSSQEQVTSQSSSGSDNSPSSENVETIPHTVERGETLWALADDNYDNPRHWPWIYDENKSDIANPNLILAGQELEIPQPESSENGFSKNDSLLVAIGYVETYRWYKNNDLDKAKYYLYAAKKFNSEILEHVDIEVDESDLTFANQAD